MHGLSCEDYFKTARKERYNLICSIGYHGIMHPTVNYDENSVGGIPLPPDSTEYVLVLLGLTMNLVDRWLQSFKKSFFNWNTIYCEKVRELFNNIHITIPEHKPDE